MEVATNTDGKPGGENQNYYEFNQKKGTKKRVSLSGNPREILLVSESGQSCLKFLHGSRLVAHPKITYNLQ